MQKLKEVYETAETAKTLATINKIEEEAQKRGIEYYSTRLDELVEDIKDEVKFSVVALSINYPSYTKPMLIVPLLQYLDLLKEKSPELHRKNHQVSVWETHTRRA